MCFEICNQFTYTDMHDKDIELMVGSIINLTLKITNLIKKMNIRFLR